MSAANETEQGERTDAHPATMLASTENVAGRAGGAVKCLALPPKPASRRLMPWGRLFTANGRTPRHVGQLSAVQSVGGHLVNSWGAVLPNCTGHGLRPWVFYKGHEGAEFTNVIYDCKQNSCK